MSNNNYAFAVAQVRAYENRLLGRSLYEQILTAPGEKEVFEILSSKGWEIPENCSGGEELLAHEQQGVWEHLSGLAGNDPEMKVFTVKNDYHNLKTAIKSFFGNIESDKDFMYPTSVDTETVVTAVKEKKYDLLPAGMQEAAEEAYNALVASNDGQTADIIIDRYTLEELLKLGKSTKSDMVRKYCELTVECSDIKTALRGAATGKNDEFFEKGLCGTDALDKRSLTRAARKGVEEVLGFLSGVGYADAAAALRVSVSEFEKWYDNAVFSILNDANFISFGIEPLIAYGFKRENEFKNIRIALTCKNMGADISVTEERMRISDV